MLATIVALEDLEWERKIKSAYGNEVPSDMTIGVDGIWRREGLVHIPESLRDEFVKNQHELPAHGHQGITKTFERIARDYHIPGLRRIVERVVGNCDICNRAKPTTHKPYGKLQPHQPPKGAWKVITMDFIVKLPKSKEPMTGVEYDSVWVVTDKLTKYVYMIPYKEGSTATQFAYAFRRHITANHGIPEEIISDRDKLWTSNFWKSLMAQLGVYHKLSTAYHPETNGQTERMNRTIEMYLRTYINEEQDSWVELLPNAQFAINSAKSETTGTSPFFANYGYEPVAYRQPRKDDTKAQKAMLEAAKLTELHRDLSGKIQQANKKMAETANKKRSMEPSLKEGDRVYLLRKNIKTKRPSDKLDFKRLGPFRITKRIGQVNYRLQLPAKSRLHPVFHVSLLEPAPDGVPEVTDAELEPEHEPDVYDVEEILDKRISNGRTEYLVKWLDWDDAHNTWEPKKNLNCPAKLRAFHAENRRHPKNQADQGTPVPQKKRQASSQQ